MQVSLCEKHAIAKWEGGLLRHLKQLPKFRIMIVSAAIPIYHLRRKRVGESPYVVEKVRGCFQEIMQKKLVFEVLVGDVGDGRLDVQNVVHHAMNHTPLVSVFLRLVSLLALPSEFWEIKSRSLSTHHDHKAKITAGHLLRDEHVRPVRVVAAPFVQYILDRRVGRENNHDFCAQYQGVNGADINTGPTS